MSKRAFLVMGTVSSGTRLMGRLLEQAGCVTDNPNTDHRQTWWNRKPHEELIVIRRHVAIGRPADWQTHPNVIIALEELGYSVHGIVMIRNQPCSELSILAAPHASNEREARWHYQHMLIDIFQNIPREFDFEVVVYDSLVHRPRLCLDLLERRWGLSFPQDIETITDGNAKYWRALRGRHKAAAGREEPGGPCNW